MAQLEFTPLEFETWWANRGDDANSGLEFTPLEFETHFLLEHQERQID